MSSSARTNVWLILARLAFVAVFAGAIVWLLLRPDNETLLRKGDAWMSNGRWHYATDAYNMALLQDSNSRAASIGLARAEYALGDYTTTLNLLTPLLRETESDWHAATLTLAGLVALHNGGDPTIYLQAAADTPTSPLMRRIANRRLAEARWARQDYPAALAAYRQINIAADSAPARSPRASQPAWDFVPFDAPSDRQRAVYYDTLLHTADNITATIRIMQALTLPELQGRTKAYAAALMKAQQLQGDEAVVSSAIGAAYIAADECGLARATLDSAAFNMDKDRPIADLFAYRSVCRVHEGDMVGAKADLDRALKIDPNSSLAHHLYARYYLAQQPPDLAAARHELDTGRDNDATNALLYLDYYDLALTQSDYAAAEQALTVFAGFAQSSDALNGLSPKAMLANFYLDSGYNLCNGTGVQVAAAAGLVGDAPGLDAQGWAEYLCNPKQPDAGFDLLLRSVQLDPASARSRYHLGSIYARMGKLTDARDQLMWAQDLAPNSAIANKALEAMVRLGK